MYLDIHNCIIFNYTKIHLSQQWKTFKKILYKTFVKRKKNDRKNLNLKTTI